jgi:hypothetical protein
MAASYLVLLISLPGKLMPGSMLCLGDFVNGRWHQRVQRQCIKATVQEAIFGIVC